MQSFSFTVCVNQWPDCKLQTAIFMFGFLYWSHCFLSQRCDNFWNRTPNLFWFISFLIFLCYETLRRYHCYLCYNPVHSWEFLTETVGNYFWALFFQAKLCAWSLGFVVENMYQMNWMMSFGHHRGIQLSFDGRGMQGMFLYWWTLMHNKVRLFRSSTASYR